MKVKTIWNMEWSKPNFLHSKMKNKFVCFGIPLRIWSFDIFAKLCNFFFALLCAVDAMCMLAYKWVVENLVCWLFWTAFFVEEQEIFRTTFLIVCFVIWYGTIYYGVLVLIRISHCKRTLKFILVVILGISYDR